MRRRKRRKLKSRKDSKAVQRPGHKQSGREGKKTDLKRIQMSQNKKNPTVDSRATFSIIHTIASPHSNPSSDVSQIQRPHSTTTNTRSRPKIKLERRTVQKGAVRCTACQARRLIGRCDNTRLLTTVMKSIPWHFSNPWFEESGHVYRERDIPIAEGVLRHARTRLIKYAGFPG